MHEQPQIEIPGEQQPDRRSFSFALLVAAAAVVIVLAGFYLWPGRQSPSRGGPQEVHPPFGPEERAYASKILIENLGLSRAENFLHQEVTILAGELGNTGERELREVEVTVELAAELEATLREFAAAAPVEVRENGGRATPLAGLSWEVRGAAEKPLLHLWSTEYNLTRRVLAITDHSEQCLTLAVERFGRSKPDRLEFVRVSLDRSAREITRRAFCEHLHRILAEQFPDEIVESLTISADLEHSLSGNYARGILRRGSAQWAVLGVADSESADTVENSLTFALLWLERVRQSSKHGPIAGLRLILPKGGARVVAQRIGALCPQLALQLYERDPVRETLERLDPRAAGNIDSWIVPPRETQALLDHARAALEPIVALAPRAISVHPSVP